MLLTCDANQGQDSAALPRARTWLPGRGEALKLRGSPDSGCTPPLSRKGQSARRKQTGGMVKAAAVDGGTQPSHQPLGGADSRVPGSTGLNCVAYQTGRCPLARLVVRPRFLIRTLPGATRGAVLRLTVLVSLVSCDAAG